MANPSIPMAGPTRLPIVAASTSRVPMMGPVQEKETSARVKAMKKMLSRPVARSALASTELLHLEGRVMSNPPKNEMAKITSNRKNAMLKMALVDSSLSLLAPKMAVMARPSER